MTHPEEAGLMAAIRQEPDNMRLRLLMADWCEDNGRPDRADFIRYSVSHGNWSVVRLDGTLSYPDPSGSGGYLNCYVGRPYGMVVTFRYGFACEVKTSWDNWTKWGPAIAVHPLERVELSDMYLAFGGYPRPAGPFFWAAHTRSTVGRPTQGEIGSLRGCLFDRLPSVGSAVETSNGRFSWMSVHYEKADAAYDELSEAMIDWARGQWR